MRTLNLLNLRAGFATNSSSSHSVLLLRQRQHDEGPDREDYGWEDFTLASAAAKRHYLGSQLAQALGYSEWLGEDEAAGEARNRRALQLVDELLGPIGEAPYGVDHQSQWSFPLNWEGSDFDRRFIAELDAFLTRDDVLVLGGNDNSEGHPLLQAHPDNAWEGLPRYSGGFVARKDEQWGHWALFNRHTGMKMRVSFEDGTPLYSAAPELVDVKLTDACPFGCDFCYMDSRPEGKHAELSDVLLVAERLAEAQVFEVALGGGEPTLHPDFLEIVDAFRSRGVVPNFTTKNLAWLRDPKTVAFLKERIGSFAYSAQSAKEVEKLAALLEECEWKWDSWGTRNRPTVHVVMGTVPREEFVAILELVKEKGLGITLLGYKRVGRGSRPEHAYRRWWLKEASEHGPYRLGIDTALAAESRSQLAKVAKPYMFHTEDGRFSAYVDATTMTMAPSSWQPERGAWPFDAYWREGWQLNASRPPDPLAPRGRHSGLAEGQIRI